MANDLINKELERAAKKGDRETVESMLGKGADPNKGNALAEAALHGHTLIVELLLNKRAKPDKGDALANAARGGHTDIVAMLLRQKVDITKSNALKCAVEHCRTDIVKLLLGHKANTNKVDALKSAALFGFKHIVQLLLEHGADPNKGNVLTLAASRGHTVIVKMLLTNGADPNKGYPLSAAARRGDKELVELLLDKGAPINAGDALESAAEENNIDIVRLLLDNGADITKGDPLSKAAWKCNADIVQLLLEKGADPNKGNALAAATVYGNMEMVNLLLSQGADPNKGGVLVAAAMLGHVYIVTLLLEQEADRNKEDPLEAAVGGGNINIVRQLLDKGADIKSSSALLKAAMNGRSDIVSLLLERGDDVEKLMTSTEMPEFEDSVKNVVAKKQEQNLQHQIDFEKGIRDAVERPCHITITVVGHKGAGKSCLVKQLIQESFPKDGPGSTDTADFYVNHLGYNPDTGIRQIITENGEMATGRNRLRLIIDSYHQGESYSEKEQSPGDLARGTRKRSTKEAKVEKREYRKEDDSPKETKQTLTVAVSTLSLPSSPKVKKKGIAVIFQKKIRQLTSVFRSKPKVSPKHREVTHKISDGEGVASQGHGGVKDVTRDYLEVVLDIMHKDTSITDEDIRDFITIYDFGGEQVFNNTHHCFMTSNMVFVIVFDVEMCLDPERAAAGYGITEQWLKNIATYAVDKSVEGKSTPPVILVGSHLDRVSSDEAEQKFKFASILETLYSNPLLRGIMDNLVQDAFPIADLNDSTKHPELYESIWQKVQSISHLQSEWAKPVPAKWTAFQYALVRLKHNGVIILSYDELLQINGRLPVPLEKGEIKDFLRNLQLNGSFHCFDLHGNKTFIVLQAQWTIDAFKTVISDPKFKVNLSPMMQLQWTKYQTTGVLPVKFLIQLWREERFINNKDRLFIVMETLNLLAKPVSEDPTVDVDYYIVPCMLPTANTEAIRLILDEPDTVKTVTLCLKFTNPFIPQAVWDKMIASCIHSFQRFKEPGHDGMKFIHRGFACLNVDFRWRVIINCKDNAMKVTMFKKDLDKSTPTGAGVKLLLYLEFLLRRILELHHQSHLEYHLYLHNDYRFASNDLMIKAADMRQTPHFKCLGSEGYTWINADDLNVWFQQSDDEPGHIKKKQSEPTKAIPDLPNRQLTLKEIGRLSAYIVGPYEMFLIELELPFDTIEQVKEDSRNLAFRTCITKALIQVRNSHKDMRFSTVADAMSKHSMDSSKLSSVLDATRTKVFKDDKRLQTCLSVNDAPIIAEKVSVKMYFNLFLELGFSPEKIDDFDDLYSRRRSREKVEAMLKSFIEETMPTPTINTILLAMQEFRMDTSAIMQSLLQREGYR